MTPTSKYGIRTLFALASLVAAAALIPAQAAAQKAFSSPEAAAEALVAAVETDDAQALRAILGRNWTSFIPIDDVDREDVETFLTAWKTAHKLVADADGPVHLAVGTEEWTLPIPIVKRGGGWRFDVQAGAEEIRTRRIGQNELSAMQAALAYCDAQKQIWEDAPMVFLWNQAFPIVHSAKVKNVAYRPNETFYTLDAEPAQ